MSYAVFRSRLQMPDDAGAGGGGGGGGAGAGAGGGGDGKGGAGAGAGAGGGAGDGKGAGGGDGKGAGDGKGGAGGAGAGGGGGAAQNAGDIWNSSRATWAGADDKKKAWAERRTDLTAVLDSAFSADQRIQELTSQVKVSAPPKDATPEQVTAWRKEQGIPEKPEGYFENLPQGLALEEQDRVMLADYMTTAHGRNMKPGDVHAFLQARQGMLDKMVAKQTEDDAKAKVTTEEALRKDWGGEYLPNINNIHAMFAQAPEGVAEDFMQARLPDGTALFNNPNAVRWFAQLAKTLNPYTTLIGPDGHALDGKGIDGRIAEIDAWMGAPKGSTDYRRYYDDPKVQAEYRDLLDRREQMRKRAA